MKPFLGGVAWASIGSKAVLTTAFDTLGAENDGVFTDNATSSNYMRVTSPWRVRGVNRLNVFLKVGILLF